MIKRELYTSRYLPPAPIWYVSETNSQDLVFVLADYDAPEGAEARIHVTRSDGTIAYVSANLDTVGGTDMVTVRPSTGLFTVPGPAIIQVQITDGETGREYVSFPVPCQVASNCTGSGTEAGDTINAFDKRLEEFKSELEEEFAGSYVDQSELETRLDTFKNTLREEISEEYVSSEDFEERLDTFSESLKEELGNKYVQLSEIPKISADAATGREIADLCEDWIAHRDKFYTNTGENGFPKSDYTDWDATSISPGVMGGRYQIDSGSFVLSILNGVSYLSSRSYQESKSGWPVVGLGAFYNIQSRPWGMSFYPNAVDAYTYGKNAVRYPGDIAKFAHARGYTFRPTDDGKNLCVGDVIFFVPETVPEYDTSWNHITHAGIYMGKDIEGNLRVIHTLPSDTSTETAPLDYGYFSPSDSRIWGAARFPLSPSGKQIENICIGADDLSERAAEHKINLIKNLEPNKWYTVALKATRKADTIVKLEDMYGVSCEAAKFSTISGKQFPPKNVPAVYVSSFRTPIDISQSSVIYLRNGNGASSTAANWDYEWLCLYEGICDVPGEYTHTVRDDLAAVTLPSVVSATEAPQGCSVSASCPDAPSSGDTYVYDTHLNPERSLGAQTATRTSDGVMYIRTLTSGGWTAWVQDKGPKGDTGATGPAGATPVKGVDYFTQADITQIVNDVIAALPNADTTGY